jgi:hypothetical protein
MAERNGWGIVYHRSDCGDDYVRMYGLGGDAPGSCCDTWGLTSHAIRYVHEHPEKNHTLEDLLALEIVDGYEIVKAGVIDAYHWVDENACNLAITALVNAAVFAAFGPEQPEGAATSTTLSLMAEPILWIEDKAEKAVVVKAMTEIIADAFLLIPEVSNSIDHSLLDNIISNCLAESLKHTELWATPAGVFIAIGAAFAPVIADLICKKTCPQGFTKAFGA